MDNLFHRDNDDTIMEVDEETAQNSFTEEDEDNHMEVDYPDSAQASSIGGFQLLTEDEDNLMEVYPPEISQASSTEVEDVDMEDVSPDVHHRYIAHFQSSPVF